MRISTTFILTMTNLFLMISGISSGSALGGQVVESGTPVVTLYLSDTQFEHLGRRPFAQNPFLKGLVPGSDRNVLATQTAATFTNELLRVVRRDYARCPMGIEVKGDIANTPAQTELTRFEKVVQKSGIPVEGYTRGNHSSGNAFGVINLFSPWYRRLQRLPLIGGFFFDKEIKEAAGGDENVLTQGRTIQTMHDLIHAHRAGTVSLNEINVEVHKADLSGYHLVGGKEKIAFIPENREKNFKTFWKPSPGTEAGLNTETRHWECLVNYDIADLEHVVDEKTHPFYLQATETARFQAKDGAKVPVFTIHLDGLDHNHLLPFDAALSELQVRLVELFMDQMLKENPRAKFKLSNHFSAESVANSRILPWRNRRARKAFQKLLSREEIILYSFGHTHERGFQDLNKTLGLRRRTSLMEINVPSLIDYHPTIGSRNKEYQDGRALVIEKLRLYEGDDGTKRVVIGLEFRGLNSDEIENGHDPRVQEALQSYSREHGYLRAMETIKMLRKHHIIGWIHSHIKRLGEVLTVGLNPMRPSRATDYWRNLSVTQYALDNLTVASTVNMFNEAYHLMPFMESVARLIDDDEGEEQLALRGQLESLRLAIQGEYVVRRHDFEEALAKGQKPSQLRQYNDLFERVGAHRLSKIFSLLTPGSRAHAFVILAGIEATRGEFEYQGEKPTSVSNTVQPILVEV